MKWIPKILVVDDEEHIRDLISQVLETEGYQIRTGRNGSECLREIQDFQPDLVILDLDMPHVRGETAINMIRNHEGMGEIPLIVVSGRGNTDTIEPLRFFEFGTFIAKPFDIEALCATVRTHLTRLDGESLSQLILEMGPKDLGLSKLSTVAAGRRCDVYVTKYQGVALRILVPEALTRLERPLLAESRVSSSLTVLADFGKHWKRLWPRPQLADPKRQLLTLSR